MPYELMIVDDKKMMRKLLRKILSIEYNIIAEAKNGIEAVEKYKEVDPDLILLDIKMPKMDGFEALSKIKDIDDSQKVILCTSVEKHNKVKKGMEGGAEAYIVKPYKKEKLMETIEEVMD